MTDTKKTALTAKTAAPRNESYAKARTTLMRQNDSYNMTVLSERNECYLAFVQACLGGRLDVGLVGGKLPKRIPVKFMSLAHKPDGTAYSLGKIDDRPVWAFLIREKYADEKAGVISLTDMGVSVANRFLGKNAKAIAEMALPGLKA